MGVTISKNLTVRENSNTETVLQKIKEKIKTLNSWLQRNISIFGRILLKMEGISRFIYPAYSLAIPDNYIKKMNKIHSDFIWNDKQDFIRRSDMVKSVEEGGMNVINVEAMNGAIKL